MARAAASRGEPAATFRRRADTLGATLNWAFGIFLIFLGVGLVLAEIDVDVSALIAGVGVVGIALGLGAQTLVKDVINGLFILIEDQYAVGDLVTVAGVTGEVTEITPRRTVLRDADGSLHVIPNSAITTATNRTASQDRVRVELEVAFREADRAAELVKEVTAELGTSLDGVGSLLRLVDERAVGDGDVRLVVAGDARRGQRWKVESELRRRLKRRFETAGVDARFTAPPAR